MEKQWSLLSDVFRDLLNRQKSLQSLIYYCKAGFRPKVILSLNTLYYPADLLYYLNETNYSACPFSVV
jgi:hypothetical protein